MPMNGLRRAHKLSKERATDERPGTSDEERRYRDYHDQQSSGERFEPGCTGGHRRRNRSDRQGFRRESGGANWWRKNVYRRRRYQGIREDDVRKNRARSGASSAASQD